MLIAEQSIVASNAETKEFLLTPHQKMLLMPIGDVHAWSEAWPAKRFRDHIQWGVDRGAYFIGMGEYVDFTSTSQRYILKEMRTSQQKKIDDWVKEDIEKLYEIIKPSTGRWLGLLEGHHYHEYEDGTTTDQHLCRLLQCPFLGTSVLFNLRLKDNRKHGCTIPIYAHHGAMGGGGRKQGSKLHRLEDLLTWVEADIYLMGHDHSKVNSPLDRIYATPGGHLYKRTKIIARTGGFLEGYMEQPIRGNRSAARMSRGGYVEQRLLPPSSLGGLVLSLGYKRIRVSGEDIVIPDIHYSV